MNKLVPVEALDRAIVMLSVAGNHCEEYAMSAVSHYDDADCDGICINDDCKTVIEMLQASPPSGGEVQGLHDGEWVNIVNHGDCYKNFTKEEAVAQAVKLTENAMRAKHSTSPRVVDEAMVSRAIEAFDDNYEAEYLLNGMVDNKRDSMKAALQAALEKP